MEESTPENEQMESLTVKENVFIEVVNMKATLRMEKSTAKV